MTGRVDKRREALQQLDEMRSWIVAQYDRLTEEAMRIADGFEEWRTKENVKHKSRERSTLSVRVRRFGDCRLVYQWSYVRFFRGKNGWVPRTRDIPKGRGYAYTRAALSRRAAGWELDKVMETEKRLEKLRREQAALGRLAREIGACMKAMAAASGEDGGGK